MHIYIDDNSNPLKEFQLPEDFFPELSRTNPFLSDEGSQSIPLTLPPSEHNLSLVDFSYRGTSTKRPKQKLAAIFSDGISWLKGTLFIESISSKSGIQTTFYTNEGRLYEKIKNYKLEDLDWPELEGVGADITAKARYWMNKFARIQMGQESQPEEYYVFVLETTFIFNVVTNATLNTELVFNETKFKDNTLSFWAMDEQKYTTETGEGQTVYTAPVGYGVTPFLRVGYILRHLFSYFGYSLESNMFDTNISLKRLVLLNNTADAIVNGTIRFKQLFPDKLTVEDFINSVRNKFGIEFIESGTTIKVKQWDNVLSELPDMDLTSMIREDTPFKIEDQQSLSLSLNIESKDLDFYYSWYKPTLTKEPLPGYKEVEIDASDKSSLPGIIYSPYLHRDHEFTVYLQALNIGGIRHKNTELVLSSGETEEEKDVECPIMYCFSYPSMQVWTNAIYPIVYKYFSGGLFSKDYNNNKWGTLSLVVNDYPQDWPIPDMRIKDNIYDVLYKKRDLMLQHANQPLIFNAVIPVYLIWKMDITRAKIIKGQKVKIERIDYVMGKPDLCKISVRTLHQYPE